MFVAEEMLDFAQQARILACVAVCRRTCTRRAASLAPRGVVPQHDRWPQLIVHYTFSSVNADTHRWAPEKPCSSAEHFSECSQR